MLDGKKDSEHEDNLEIVEWREDKGGVYLFLFLTF